jgi:hypothetical protein
LQPRRRAKSSSSNIFARARLLMLFCRKYGNKTPTSSSTLSQRRTPYYSSGNFIGILFSDGRKVSAGYKIILLQGINLV